eukprot:489260-Rhodomonas_salina.1
MLLFLGVWDGQALLLRWRMVRPCRYSESVWCYHAGTDIAYDATMLVLTSHMVLPCWYPGTDVVYGATSLLELHLANVQ